MRIFLISLASFLFAEICLGQKISVDAQIIEKVEDSYCIRPLKDNIIEAAKLKAIANQCGTFLNSDTKTEIKNKIDGQGVKSSTSFHQYINTQVKGDWIKTTSQKLEWLLQKENGENQLYITCTIQGLVRCRNKAMPKLEIYTTSINPEDLANIQTYHTTEFKHNSPLYIYFRSPTKGYLSIFLFEDINKVYHLLPYTSMKVDYPDTAPIKADKKYLLFSKKHPNYKNYKYDPLGLDQKGFHQLYIIFSEKDFKKPITDFDQNNKPKYLKPDKFEKWLSSNMAADESFQKIRIPITVLE